MGSIDVAKEPRPPALQDPPSDGFFNETQWAVYFALMDAALPAIVSQSALTDKFNQVSIPDARFQKTLKKIQDTMTEAPDLELFQAFLKDRPSESAAFRNHAVRTLTTVSEKMRQELGGVLTLLSTKTGAFLLTGHCIPFHEQPAYMRESVLQSWRGSWFTKIRVLAKSASTLAQIGWIQTAPIFRQVSGYPDVPIGWKASPSYEFSFLQFPAATAGSEPAELETDVVIVGSGCGGAVCAQVLAEAGHRVLVVDKGYYFPTTALPMPQETGARYLYENQGFVNSADSSIAMVAGSTWGGGGTVNWSVSLQTQGYVRREWTEEKGLSFFTTQAFQDSLDRVCDFMGVRDDNVPQTHRGQVILDGSKKLGWHAKPLPQNSGGKEHYCGHCHLGCNSDKQGPTASWLPAAARAGAEFIEGFHVEKVLLDKSKKATGVVGWWTSRDANGSVSGPLKDRTRRQVTIKAKKVIVACGSLWSPLVLLKSGLKNRHIGRNLHMHPCNFAGGFYKEDIRPWEGGIITSYCSSFENLDGHGHGTKLESTCMVPYAVLANLPCSSGLDFKLSAMRYRHFDAFISLTRDRDSGSVRPDPKGEKPILDYTPSAFDRAHALEGVIGLCKLLYITGAVEIRAFLPGVEPFIRKGSQTPVSSILREVTRSDKAAEEGLEVDLGISDPAFKAWLDHVRAVGNAPPTAVFISAHQMGSNRMSSSPSDGVVDAKGKVWGTKDLYVADASVFPSASGVNPMITNMAIADWIARGVDRDLKG